MLYEGDYIHVYIFIRSRKKLLIMMSNPFHDQLLHRSRGKDITMTTVNSRVTTFLCKGVFVMYMEKAFRIITKYTNTRKGELFSQWVHLYKTGLGLISQIHNYNKRVFLQMK